MMPRCVCLRLKMTLEKGAGQGLGLGSRGFALFLHERCVAAVAALCSLSCVVSACALPPFFFDGAIARCMDAGVAIGQQNGVKLPVATALNTNVSYSHVYTHIHTCDTCSRTLIQQWSKGRAAVPE